MLKYHMNIFVLLAMVLFSSTVTYAGLDEFDLSNNAVDLSAFTSGGPRKDGIPALTKPKFIPANKATYLRDNDRVVGIFIEGQAKAYPIRILNWHEIVNDEVADTPIAVTWCPLTRSAVTFDRRLKGTTLEFGVSGLLYKSNVVMYDRNDEGLWSQLKMEGLTGKFAQERLKQIPAMEMTWGHWLREHPDTLVLSRKTGHRRDYNRDPYKDYHHNSETMFPLAGADLRLPPKSLVIGIQIGDIAKAYPLTALKQPIDDHIGGMDVNIKPVEGGTAVMTDNDGNITPSVVAYWFAWSAFHPDTLIYQSNN